MRLITAIFAFLLLTISGFAANKDTMIVVFHVKKDANSIKGVQLKLVHGEAVIDQHLTNSAGIITFTLDKKAWHKKTITVIAEKHGFWEYMKEITLKDGEKYPVQMQSMTEADIISMVESKLDGKPMPKPAPANAADKKKAKEPKPEKEKKEKKPKPEKVKKEKAPKPPKEDKPAKEKKAKEPKPVKEKTKKEKAEKEPKPGKPPKEKKPKKEKTPKEKKEKPAKKKKDN